MKLVMVSLPWSVYERPSAALGALAAYVGEKLPGVQVQCRYEYVPVALDLGIPLYDAISLEAYDMGELFYAPFVYPEQSPKVRAYFAATAEGRGKSWRTDNVERFPEEKFGEAPTWPSIHDEIAKRLEANLDRVVAEVVAAKPQVLGLTTSFGQLFANLSLAKRVKAALPEVVVVMGGSTVSAEVGPSLLKEYEFLDYVVQGEGEQPLIALLEKLQQGTPKALFTVPGVLTRAAAEVAPRGAALWEVPQMDALPYPDYDAYAKLAEEHGVLWLLSIEGSRGCWWDRTKRTGNPKATCHFCNLNVQWNGYREKSTPRLVKEMSDLSERYGNGAIFFLDNIIRSKGVGDFGDAIAATGKEFALFYEMRANVSPAEVLSLWRAGVKYVQFGIEGLSSSYLKRVGKGTSAIQNLQAMKACHELNITNNANLLTHFPGGTQEEVDETVTTILTAALPFEPLNANRFWLGRGSTIDVLRQQFPITNIRNADFYRHGLPDEVYQRLALFDLSYDLTPPLADWAAVYEACSLWEEAYAKAKGSQYRHLMAYLDGGSFLRLYDGRSGEPASAVLRGLERDLYLYLAEVKSRAEVTEHFVTRKGKSVADIEAILGQWTERGWVFAEKDRLLSLAPAFSPELAARRIERAGAFESGEVARVA